MNKDKLYSQEETLTQLTSTIQSINDAFQLSAASAINKHVTCRNWLTGYYIVHYEQNGNDRAQYGERLLQNLAERLKMKGFSYRDLKLYRQFFLNYRVLSSAIYEYIINKIPIGQSVIAQLEYAVKSIPSQIGLSAIAQLQLTESQEHLDTTGKEIVPANILFNNLSFTHFVQLLPINEPLERAFYEVECIKGTWSVRELQRQIRSGYYVRSGLSKDKDDLQKRANTYAELTTLYETIKSPFVFEFLGLDTKDVVEESEFETALIDHLQEFLLELGNGFCFESRQKRILIDEEYYYIDLLFYNRLARFGVVIELKSHKLDYKDIAQLNMYLAYYRKNMMQTGDNPPIGILLCTEKGEEMVEYATSGIDEHLLISQYMLKLPSKKNMEDWLQKQLKELGTFSKTYKSPLWKK